jgi:vitellogenic carboxypeptidase-like protein
MHIHSFQPGSPPSPPFTLSFFPSVNVSSPLPCNQVGTGYSYTEDEGGYSRDQDSCAHNLRTLLMGFYEDHPEAKNRELWVTGESYAGKYVPALSHLILESNREVAFNDVSSPEYLPIAGMAVGNGLTDPISQEPTKPVYACKLRVHV